MVSTRLKDLNEELNQRLNPDSQKNKAAEEIGDFVMPAKQFVDSLAKENPKKGDDECADRNDSDHPHRCGKGDGGRVSGVDC